MGLVAALWPWLTWPQRVVGVATAAAVALNRLYIGAHWPVDVVGGAAIEAGLRLRVLAGGGEVADPDAVSDTGLRHQD